MLVFHNEDHVKTGQYGWHEVYILEKERKGKLTYLSRLKGIDKQGTSVLTSSPLVSSQRPNTEFAAASTEHLEFNVVVIPALKN